MANRKRERKREGGKEIPSIEFKWMKDETH